MKKPDRKPRPRIAASTEKKDPWRDAPKEEILARGKKRTDRPAAAPRAKKSEQKSEERGERPQRGESNGKKSFGAEHGDKRSGGARRDERGPYGKTGFKKEGTNRPGRDTSGDSSARPRPFGKDFKREERSEGGERKSFARPSGGKEFPKNKRDDRREDTRAPRAEKPFGRKPRPSSDEGPTGPKRREDDRPSRPAANKKPFQKKPQGDRDERPTREDRPGRAYDTKRPAKTSDEKPAKEQSTPGPAGAPMTLNKYLAHAGISSRRDAATVIKEGKVKVNGEVLLTPGYRVLPTDKVTFEGKAMKPETKKVYVLLNKPKGFITTTEDEHDRRTVMELVQAVEADRLYPVGRLDRNTTGLLLLTNDGDLAQRLTHPKYEAKKIYQVGLDKPLTKADFEKLATGVELEDGVAKPDKLAFLDEPNEVGLEIHSGRNRIVRRMFEALGYEVERLDRVMFAGLTKKNIPRGQWRHLTEQEVVRLKHFKS